MQIVRLKETPISTATKLVIGFLQNGGIGVIPTDTVYGIAASADNNQAIQKINQFKSRPAGMGISIFVPNIESAQKYVKITRSQKVTADKLLPGPFTVIFDSLHILPESLEGSRGTLGIRIINNDFVNALVGANKSPITATSANQHGRGNISSLDAFIHQTPKSKLALLDFFVDAGPLPKKLPSTVLDLSSDKIKIYRRAYTKSKQISQSPEETKDIAKSLFLEWMAMNIHHPLVITLSGKLGSGKTVFAKGIAELFGIKSLRSPSFQLMNEYDIDYGDKTKFNHWDLYFLRDSEEWNYLDTASLNSDQAVSLIEWSEKGIAPFLSKIDYYDVLIDVKPNFTRTISWVSKNPD